MIKVTRLNNTELIINSDLIEFIEETPDTVISLITGRKVVVQEKAEEVISRVIAYKHLLYSKVNHQGPVGQIVNQDGGVTSG